MTCGFIIQKANKRTIEKTKSCHESSGETDEHRFKHVRSVAEMDIFTDVRARNKLLHHVSNGDEILAKKAIGK